MLSARPYCFAVPARSDPAEAEQLLADGSTAAALALARERLLAWSSAPLIAEARERLEVGLRTAIMREDDPELFASWCASEPGEQDEPAARALLESLSASDPRLAAARAHLARLGAPARAEPSAR